MPGPLDYLRTLGFKLPEAPAPLSPEEQQAADIQAQKAQAQDPAWKQYARKGFEGGMEALKGLVAGDPTQPPTSTPNWAGQMVGASLPVAGGLLKGIPGTFSRLTRAVEAMPEMVTPGKVLSTVRSAATPEEAEYRGLTAFLGGRNPAQKMPKSEILGHLEQNPMDVSVKRLGEPLYDAYSGENPNLRTATGLTHQEVVDYINREQGGFGSTSKYVPQPTKWSGYALPGGQNYREDLIQLPSKGGKTVDQIVEDMPYGADPTTIQAEINRQPDYIGPHYDDPNVLAHVRHAEHTLLSDQDKALLGYGHEDIDPTGSRGRLIENLQSDWHQTGAREGYTTTVLPEGYTIKQTVPSGGRETSWSQTPAAQIYEVRGPNDEWIQAGLTPEDAIANALDVINRKQVPDAPFKANWPDLALKQQILDIVNNHPNLDWIGFTPGEELIIRGEGMPHTPGITLERPARANPHLPLADQPRWNDVELPNRLAKLLKPFGGSIEDLQLGSSPSQLREGPLSIKGARITPEMRKAIKERGFPLATLAGLYALGQQNQQ